jgi:hypothetical protein
LSTLPSIKYFMFHQFVWFIQITVFALFPAMIFYICPADCTFICNPAGNAIAVDHNIINNTSLRDVFAKEPTFFIVSLNP